MIYLMSLPLDRAPRPAPARPLLGNAEKEIGCTVSFARTVRVFWGGKDHWMGWGGVVIWLLMAHHNGGGRNGKNRN
jgi:hypothetical protein